MADDMLNILKGMLGDNAEEKIQSVLSALGNSQSVPEENSVPTSSDNFSVPASGTNPMESIGNLKNIFESIGSPNDSRTNLLMSLRPYMRSQRQQSIDSAIKLLNLSRFSGIFKL